MTTPQQLDLFAEPPARIATEPERIAGGCAERPIVTPSRLLSEGLVFDGDDAPLKAWTSSSPGS
jgi:hypothetical protein